MTIITSCPECNTQFVVTNEQLSAYNGKVRCGTCNHVFNANDYFVESNNLDSISEESTKSNITKSTTGKSSTSKLKKKPPKKVESLIKNVSLDETSNENSVIDNENEQNIDDSSIEANQNSFEENNAELDIVDDANASSELIVQTNESSAFQTNSVTTAQIKTDSPSPVKDLTLDERLNQLSKKKPLNWLLVFLTLFLLLALLAQLAYFLRTEVVSRFSQTKHIYATVCKELGCKVELPKELEFLTIDDSDMQEHLERENVLQFSSTLINHANYPQAYPTVELTLTNTDDEPVLRKTLKPAQYLSDSSHIEDGITAKEEIRIKLNISVENIPVAGYRVALAY
jgi:predicted Zn finger-like uncharacterized protein